MAPAAVATPFRAELALEAWLEVQPGSYSVSQECLPGLLAVLLAQLPAGTPDATRELCRTQEPHPRLLQILRPEERQIHFLYYWKAFGGVLRLARLQTPPGSFARDVEALRDSLLFAFEVVAVAGRRAAPGDAGPQPKPLRATRIALTTVKEEIARLLSASGHRRFWRDALQGLEGLWPAAVDLETCTQMLVGWLLHAVAETERPDEHHDEPPPRPVSTRRSGQPGTTVSLHIYDVSQSVGIQVLNTFLAHEYSPLKFGGIFHAGVEVGGIEWGYGYCTDPSKHGVESCLPGRHRQHHYRQTVVMPCTHLAAAEVDQIVSRLLEVYKGSEYDLFRRNCCHFANDFCQRLGVGPLPGWVYRLARVGAALDWLNPGSPKGCGSVSCASSALSRPEAVAVSRYPPQLV